MLAIVFDPARLGSGEAFEREARAVGAATGCSPGPLSPLARAAPG